MAKLYTGLYTVIQQVVEEESYSNEASLEIPYHQDSLSLYRSIDTRRNGQPPKSQLAKKST